MGPEVHLDAPKGHLPGPKADVLRP